MDIEPVSRNKYHAFLKIKKKNKILTYFYRKRLKVGPTLQLLLSPYSCSSLLRQQMDQNFPRLASNLQVCLETPSQIFSKYS